MSAASIVACPTCCGGAGTPNTSCGCVAGVPGGITACDGNSQAWPVKAVMTVESLPASQTAVFAAGVGQVTGMSDGYYTNTSGPGAPVYHYLATLSDLTDALTINPNFGYVSLAQTASITPTSLVIDDNTANGCYTSIEGYYRKVTATSGESYEFDTIEGTGLPKLLVSAEVQNFQSAFDRRSSESYDSSGAYTGGQAYNDTNSVEIAIQSSDIAYRAIAQISSGGGAGQIVLILLGYANGPVILISGDEENYGSNNGTKYLNSKVVTEHRTQMPGFVYTTISAATGSDDAVICDATINAATTDAGVSKFDARIHNAGSSGGTLVFNKSYTQSSSSGQILIGKMSGTLSPGSPGNPGCQNAPRWIRVKRWRDGVLIIDHVMAQTCYERQGIPTSTWPYACEWLTRKVLAGSPDGVSLVRVGPTMWELVGAAGRPYPQLRVKHDQESPVGMTECEHEAYAEADTVKNNTQLIDGVTHSSSSGNTKLTKIFNAIEVTLADALTCLTCACDPECDPCQHCLPTPSVLAVHVLCQYRPEPSDEDEDPEPITFVDEVFKLNKQSAEPCYLRTGDIFAAEIGPDPDTGWRGTITLADDPDDATKKKYFLDAYKTGVGEIHMTAECGGFDLSTLDWELVSETVSSTCPAGNCGDDGLEVHVG